MKAPITDKHLLEMMWDRFPEIMKRGIEQPAQQEPVAWMNAKRDMTYLHGPYNADDSPLYTSPPAQRKPLSVDEIFEAIRPLYSSDKAAWLAVNHSKDEYRAIEAAHNIKENT